jgi:hypothetical protein
VPPGAVERDREMKRGSFGHVSTLGRLVVKNYRHSREFYRSSGR